MWRKNIILYKIMWFTRTKRVTKWLLWPSTCCVWWLYNEKATEKNRKLLHLFQKNLRRNWMFMYIIKSKYFTNPKIIRSNLNYIISLKIREKRKFQTVVNWLKPWIKIRMNWRWIRIHIKNATENDEMSFLKIDIVTRDDNKMLSKNFTGFYKNETTFYDKIFRIYI